jgi:ParB family chromosome partitioning protein
MSQIVNIPIAKIRLLNPRVRGKAKFKEIVNNIAVVGLKRPITVAPREEEPGTYDLVCGQGRMEAYQALGETEVPALVREVPKQDRYIMSLVENLARSRSMSMARVRELQALRERG